MSSIPRPALAGFGLLAVLGVVAFLAGLATDAPTAWRAFHVNYLYFAGIAQGGLLLSAIFVIVGARWPGPVQRIAEGLAAWVPITFVLALVGFLGRDYIYVWIEHPIPAKQAWLNVPRLVVTQLAIFGVLAVLSMAFLRASQSGGEGEERAADDQRLRRLAPIICLVYAVGYSLVAFDQVMSLSPTWFSNLFGAYFAWGAFLSAVSVTTLLSVLHRNHPGLEGQFTRHHFHDLGKMIFAFSVFWMYLFFSQYMIIWYGNLPEETSFIKARLGTQFLQDTWFFAGFWDRIFGEPWVQVTLFAWICIWVIPFWFLLGQRPKRTAWFLASVATVSAFGFWVERNVLIWPSLVPQDTWAFLGWIQIGIALGFLGAFALVYLFFTRSLSPLGAPAARA